MENRNSWRTWRGLHPAVEYDRLIMMIALYGSLCNHGKDQQQKAVEGTLK